MSQSENQFLDFIKGAEAPATNEDEPAKGEVEVYSSQTSDADEDAALVAFSDTAQASNKDVREGVVNRLLDNVQKERALVGNILPKGETSAIQLGLPEKVSSVRARTLTEMTHNLLGR